MWQRIKNGGVFLTEKTERVNFQGMMDGLVILIYVFFLAKAFFGKTMFRFDWPDYFADTLNNFLPALVALRLCVSGKWKGKEIVCMLLFVVCFSLSVPHSGYEELTTLLWLILGLAHMPFEKIARTFFVTVSALLGVTVIAALTEYIPNLVYYFSDRGQRISFGVIYPTDFSAFLLFLDLTWIYLRTNRMRVFEWIAVAATGLFTWFFCDARLSSLLIEGTCALFLCLYLWKKYAGKEGEEAKPLPGWLPCLMKYASVLCAAFILAASYFYSADSRIAVFLDGVLNSRLHLAKQGMDEYGFTVFGQYIQQLGNGGSSALSLIDEYFFLDSSYVSALLRYGLLIFLCMMILLLVPALRAARSEDYGTLILLTILAGYGVVEHHLLEPVYNPFLFLLLAGRAGDERNAKITEEKGRAALPVEAAGGDAICQDGVQ